MALGPMPSNITVPEHKHCDTVAANLITEAAVKGLKGRSVAQDSIVLHRIVCDLQL